MKRNYNEQAMIAYFWENYTGDKTTLKDACKEIVETGRAIYNYPRNLQLFPAEADRLADYFQGLPTLFYPTPYYHEIEENLRKWGIIKENWSDSRIWRAKENWWFVWAQFCLKEAK